MRLTFKPFDGPGYNYRPVVDEDTGKEIGHITSNGVGLYRYGGIEVSLFDGKYRIAVNKYDECVGFVKGVEAVLKHMVSVENQTDSSWAA